MKRIFLTGVILMVAVLANAQEMEKTMWILRPSLNSGGMTGKTINGTTDATARIGFGLGVEYMQMMGKRFYFSGMASFNSRGYKDVRSLYLDVPVTLNALLGENKHLIVGAGVYGGIALTGKYKNSNGWTNIKFGEGTADNRSRTDAGLVFSGGYTSSYVGIWTVDFLVGMKNVIPKDRQVTGTYNRLKCISFSAGLPLSLFKKKK